MVKLEVEYQEFWERKENAWATLQADHMSKSFGRGAWRASQQLKAFITAGVERVYK